MNNKNEVLQKLDEIERINAFIPHFVKALQVDDDASLLPEELHNFDVILKCSVVTSVNAGLDETESDEREWDYRNKNKELVKEVADRLKDIGTFTAWMPRKTIGNVKFSDISGWYLWNTEKGFDCKLEYYLSRVNDFTIGLTLMLSLDHGKGLEETFFNVFGNDPLKPGFMPQKEDWGRYRYNNVLRINANDSSAVDQIVGVVRKAYSSAFAMVDNYKVE